MSTTVTTTVDIPAASEAVWEVMTDFAAYGEWNPFMDRVEGTPLVGSKPRVHMNPPGGRDVTFRPTVLAAVPGRELRWLDTLGVRGLFDGEHSFTLTADGNGGTRLTHGKRLSGVLVTLTRDHYRAPRAAHRGRPQVLETEGAEAITWSGEVEPLTPRRCALASNPIPRSRPQPG